MQRAKNILLYIVLSYVVHCNETKCRDSHFVLYFITKHNSIYILSLLFSSLLSWDNN